jgi:membrane associated rhomboid family serine protease
MRTVTDHTPPWMSASLFGRPGASSPYGYVTMAKGVEQSVPCSFTALEDAIRSDIDGRILSVWTPLAPDQLMVVSEVPLLEAAQIECIALRARRARFLGILMSIALLTMISLSLSQMLPVFMIWTLLYVSQGVGMLALGVRTLAQIRRRPAWEILHEHAHALRFAIWMGRQRARGLWALAGIIAVVGAAQLFAIFQGGGHDPIARAGIVKAAVWQGEPWRLATGALLHGNLIHLVLNLVALIVLARYVEFVAHWSAVPLVFLIGALAGSLLSALLDPRTSVGSSGGIMGLIGAAIGLGLSRRASIPQLSVQELTLSVTNILISGILFSNIIDNWAHLGGLIAGLLLGWLLARSPGVAPIRLGYGLQSAGALALGATAAVGMLTIWLIFR